MAYEIDGKQMAQEELIIIAAGEYCQSVLKVDSDIEDSVKEMANGQLLNIPKTTFPSIN